MKLEELKCINHDNDLNEYLKFYKYVKDNMQHPEWLGEFTKEELEYILKNDGKLFNYYNDKDLVCSVLYIPSNNKTLIKHKINYDESLVGSCGSIMVNPKYVGNGLQKQLLNMLDNYCSSINKKYIFTKIHPDNIYSIKNFENDGYVFIEQYEAKDGIRNCYLKKI